MTNGKVFIDHEGLDRPERRRHSPRNIPSWVDYGVISGVISLIFTTGIQYNKLEDMRERMKTLQDQITYLVGADPKAKIAVLEDHEKIKDAELAEFKDTMLRRFDRMDAKLDARR